MKKQLLVLAILVSCTLVSCSDDSDFMDTEGFDKEIESGLMVDEDEPIHNGPE